MQALKALVIFMGVLIVIMMAAVGYGIVVRFGNVTDGVDGTDRSDVTAGVWAEDLQVSVSADARVAETVVAEGWLVVRLVFADGSQRYLVFDLETGERVGAIDLVPEAARQ